MSTIHKPNGIIQQDHLSYIPRYELPNEDKSYYLNVEQTCEYITYNINNLHYSNIVKTSNTATKQFIFPHVAIDSNSMEDAFTKLRDGTSKVGRNLYQCISDSYTPLLNNSLNQKVINIIWNPYKQCYVALVLRWTISNSNYTYTSVILQSIDGVKWIEYTSFNDTAFRAMEYWAGKIYFLGAVANGSTIYLRLCSIPASTSQTIVLNTEITYNTYSGLSSSEKNIILVNSQACLASDDNTLCFVTHSGGTNNSTAYYGLGRLLYDSSTSVEYKTYSTSTLPMNFSGALGEINLTNMGAGKYIISNVDNSSISAYVYYTPRTSYNSDTLTPITLRNNTNYTMFIKQLSPINQNSKLGYVAMGGTASNRGNYIVNVANNISNIFALKTWQEPVGTELNYSQAVNTGGSSYLFNTNNLTNQVYCTSSFPYQSGAASSIASGYDDTKVRTCRTVKFYEYDASTRSYLYASSLKAEKNWQILDKVFVFAYNGNIPELYYSNIKM